MADLSDVENALREAVQAVRDTAFPGISVYRGWPAAKRLDDIVQANGSQDQAVRIKASVVTVFPAKALAGTSPGILTWRSSCRASRPA